MTKFLFLALVQSLFAFGGMEEVLDGYHGIQSSLAGDKFPQSQQEAARLLNPIDHWLKTEKETHPAYGNVQKMYSGAYQMSQSSVEEALRSRFGILSEGVVEFIRKEESLKQRYQLFYCPMANPYRYWVQPKGEKMANPYMGLSMPNCGSKRPW